MYLLLIVVVWLVLSVPAALVFGAVAGGIDRIGEGVRSCDRPGPNARRWNLAGNRCIVVPVRTGGAAWSKNI